MINPKPPLDSFYNEEAHCFKMEDDAFHNYNLDEIAEYFEKRRDHLLILELSNNQLIEEDFSALAILLNLLPGLMCLIICHERITAFGAKLLAIALADRRAITSLVFNFTSLEDDACLALCPLIANNPLEFLSLIGNNFTQKSIKALAGALEKKHSLRKIRLAHNQLEPQAIILLANVLEKYSDLEHLHVENNKLDNEEIKAIARIVKNNRHLNTLDVSHNDLTIEGILAIATALANHTEIENLFCQRVFIDQDSEKAILHILQKNRILSLSISNNNRNYNFLPAFFKWLDTKPSLTSLDLRANFFSENEILSLVEKLAQLPKLENIILDNNDISDTSALTILNGVKAYPHPLFISLGNNEITKKGKTDLENTLQSINATREQPLTVNIGLQKTLKLTNLFPQFQSFDSEFRKFMAGLQAENPALTQQQFDSLCLFSNWIKKTGFFTEVTDDIFNYTLKEKANEGASLVYYLVDAVACGTLSTYDFKEFAPKIKSSAWNCRFAKSPLLTPHSPATYFLTLEQVSMKEKLILLLQYSHLISIMDLDALRVLKNIVTREENLYFIRQYKKFFERLNTEAPASAAHAATAKKSEVRESKPISAAELEELKKSLSGQERSVALPDKQKPATLEKQLQLYFPEGKSLIRYTRQNQGNKCCLSFYADTQKVLSDFFASLKPFLGNPPYAGNITVKHAQGKPFSFSLTAKETTLFNFFDNPKLIPSLSGVPASSSGSTSGASSTSASSGEKRQALKTLSQEDQNLWKKNLCAFFCNAEELSVLWLDQEGFILLLPPESAVWSVHNYKGKSSERSYFRLSSEFILNQMLSRAQKQYEETGEAKFEWESNLPLDRQFIKMSIYDSHPSMSVENHQRSIFSQLTKEADVALAPLSPTPKITDFDGLQAELARRNSGGKEEIPDDDDDSDYLSDSDEEDFEKGSASAAAKPREESLLQDEELALAKLESFVDPATQEIDLPNYCRLLFQLISAAHFAELQEFRFLNIEKLKPGKWDFCFNLVGIPYLQGHEKAINPLLLLEAIQKSLESHQLSIHTNTYEKGGVAHATINQAAVSKLHQTLKDNPLLIRNLQACCANFNLEKSDDSGVSLSTLSQVVAPKSHTAKIIHRSYKHYIGRHQTEEQTKCLINTIRRLEGMPKKNFHYHLNRLQNIPKPQTPDSDKNTVFFYSYLAHTMRVCHLLARQFGFYYPSEFGKKQNTYLRLRNAIRHAANELSWEDFYAAVHPFFTDLKTLQKELPKPTSDVTFFDYLPTKIYIESESVKKLQDLIQQFIARLDAHTLGDDALEKDYAPILSTIESAELSVVEKRDRRDALIMVHALQHKKEEWHSLDSQLSREYGHEGFDQPYETFAPQLFARYVQSQKQTPLASVTAPAVK